MPSSYSDMKLVSVNVGLPRLLAWGGATFKTGIFKHPVEGRVVLRTTNLDGVWTVLLTTNAPPHGVWIYTDNNPPQPAAFYRLEQN